MALDPLTWLLISASIIAAYCIALKLSERSQEIQVKENPEPWPPTVIPREPEPQVMEIPADVIQASEKPNPQAGLRNNRKIGPGVPRKPGTAPRKKRKKAGKGRKGRGPSPFPNPNS